MFEEFSSIRVKVVERAGEKLIDSLHRSNPWDKMKCERKDCRQCNSKEEKLWGSCKNKNKVYENECYTCLETIEEEKKEKQTEGEKIDENTIIETGKKRKTSDRENRKIEEVEETRKYKYIGKSSRSAYERNTEHWKDLENLNPRSHILKHYLDKHQDIPMEKLNMRMKVLKKFKSSFERQIGESVMINHNMGLNVQLLNSKNEYNRCSIPRLALKMDKDELIEEYEEEQAEKEMKRRIERLREKMRMEGGDQQKRKKMRKLDMTVPLKTMLKEIIAEEKTREIEKKEKKEN